jgi:hypothetical protein
VLEYYVVGSITDWVGSAQGRPDRTTCMRLDRSDATSGSADESGSVIIDDVLQHHVRGMAWSSGYHTPCAVFPARRPRVYPVVGVVAVSWHVVFVSR